MGEVWKTDDPLECERLLAAVARINREEIIRILAPGIRIDVRDAGSMSVTIVLDGKVAVLSPADFKELSARVLVALDEKGSWGETRDE